MKTAKTHRLRVPKTDQISTRIFRTSSVISLRKRDSQRSGHKYSGLDVVKFINIQTADQIFISILMSSPMRCGKLRSFKLYHYYCRRHRLVQASVRVSKTNALDERGVRDGETINNQREQASSPKRLWWCGFSRHATAVRTRR